MRKLKPFYLLAALASVALMATSACTAVMSRNKNAQLNIRISNLVKSSGKSLTAQSVIYPTNVCYAVHITGPHPMLRRQPPKASEASCPANSGGLGLLVGFFNPGSAVELDIPVGPERRVDLIAMPKSAFGGTCPQGLHGEPNASGDADLFIGSTPLPINSSMHLLARNTMNVVPGSNSLVLEPFMNPSTGTHGMTYGCHQGGNNSNDPDSIPTWPWIDPMDNNIRTGMKPMYLEVSCDFGVASTRLTVPGLSEVTVPCNGPNSTFHDIQHTVGDNTTQTGWKIESLDAAGAVLKSQDFGVSYSSYSSSGGINHYRVMEASGGGPFERIMTTFPNSLRLIGWDHANKRVFVNGNHTAAIDAGAFSFADSLQIGEVGSWYQNINSSFSTINGPGTSHLSGAMGSYLVSAVSTLGLIFYNNLSTFEFIKGFAFGASFISGSLAGTDGSTAFPSATIPLLASDGDFQAILIESSGWSLKQNYYLSNGSGAPNAWGSTNTGAGGSSNAYQLELSMPPTGNAFWAMRTDSINYPNNVVIRSCLNKTYCGDGTTPRFYSSYAGTSATKAILLNTPPSGGLKEAIHFYHDGGTPQLLTGDILQLSHANPPATQYAPAVHPVFYPDWQFPIVKFGKAIKTASTYGNDLLIGGLDYDGTDYRSVIYRSRDNGRHWYRVYGRVIPNMSDYVVDALEVQLAYTNTSSNPPTTGYYPGYMLIEQVLTAGPTYKYRVLMQEGHGF